MVNNVSSRIDMALCKNDMNKIEKSIESCRKEIGLLILKEGLTLKVIISLQWLTNTEEEYVTFRQDLLLRSTVIVPISSLVGGVALGSSAIILAHCVGISTILSGGMGFSVGLGIGAALGFVVSFERSRRMMNETQLNMNEFRKSEIVDSALNKFISEDDTLNECICPITHALFNVPVIDPNGHTYECEDIVKWVSKNPDRPSPLMAAIKFTVSDLRLDCGMREKIATRMQEIYNLHIITLKKDDILKKDFTIFASQMNAQSRDVFAKMTIALSCLREDGILDEDTFHKETEKLFKSQILSKIIKMEYKNE